MSVKIFSLQMGLVVFKVLIDMFNGKKLDLLCLMLEMLSQNNEYNFRQESTVSIKETGCVILDDSILSLSIFLLLWGRNHIFLDHCYVSLASKVNAK